MRRTRALLAAAVAAALTAAGCTTVPDSSQPQVVQPVAVHPQGGTPVPPPEGADPRDIVAGFLDKNGVDEPNHASARLYLSRDERNRWRDSTVTVVDSVQIRNMAPAKPLPSGVRTGTVTVTGNQIGTIDETGTYKPSLRGDGSGLGGGPWTQTYGLARVAGEWRIDSLPPGLVVTLSQFEAFRQFPVYFFDAAEQHLVPEPRYTQLSSAPDIVNWLAQELAQGPVDPQLQTGLPGQNGVKTVTVGYPADPSDPNTPVTIEVPGSSQLDAANLDRLAAQIAATLQPVPQVDRIELTDSEHPVRVPAAGGTTFTAQMVDLYQPAPPANLPLFYVRSGAVYQDSGRRIPGKAGLGVYGLTSVAVTRFAGSDSYRVAGVRGFGAQAVLDIPGARGTGLVATTVHGLLSRPAWAPGRDEVWIGNGNSLERVTGPRAVQTVSLDVSQGKASGRVSAVRISPDGGRVALVLTAADTSQIYIGNIVRNGTDNQVSVNNLQPISPQGVLVTDVAWNDELKLFAIGRDTLTGVDQVYEVQCDGSVWNPRGNLGLPGAPDSVTAASGAAAVVSSLNTIFQQQGAGWQGLLGGETFGTNPVYLE